MFPSKSIGDCVGETSRFFPTIRMDGDTSNTFTSPFQTPLANRYSSSTDSTSPESYYNTSFPVSQTLEPIKPTSHTPKTYDSRPYYDSQPFLHDSPTHIVGSPLTAFNINSNTSFERNMTGLGSRYDNKNTFERNLPVFETQNYNQRNCDTPFQLRRQRAIVGRKILEGHSRTYINELLKPESDLDFNIWQPMPMHASENHSQYELFPSNEKPYEFHTQKKSYDLNTVSPTSSLMSSSFLSQTSPNRSQYENWSPIPNRIQDIPPATNRMPFSSNNFNLTENHSQTPKLKPLDIKPPYTPSLYTGPSSSQDGIGPTKMCTLCRKNGETPSVYMKHCVKEKIGNRYVVTCPILRALVCVTCGASGDDAHTITYCPLLRSNNNGKPLQSTTITLKNTRIKSNGRKRY